MLMVEIYDENMYVRHHKQKIVLILSAMRHFAELLSAEGMNVDYVRLEDRRRPDSYTAELRRALQCHSVERIVVTEPGEWRAWEMVQEWRKHLGMAVEVRGDDRFLCSLGEFGKWASGRNTCRMEHFYRYMRRRTGWLMSSDGKPEVGRWNYDIENRKRLPSGLTVPPARRYAPDATTRSVMIEVARRFGNHFGQLDSFGWAVTREEAVDAFEHFVGNCLPHFGAYQDAMKVGEDFLFHSVLSPYLNIGLLTPREVCEAVMAAYRRGSAPLPAVEGFVRQILGWREYVRGIYWTHMPDYAKTNYLRAKRRLPEFYWSGQTDMRCLRETIEATRRNAYAHHIQRLMITGNFALLSGIAPADVEEWYLIVYADAFEWAELPNTHGMALYADGGLLASKPYAASGAYIHRMTDYCSQCCYDHNLRIGAKACPFNYLYWYFLSVNENLLSSNPRLALAYRSLRGMAAGHRAEIARQAEHFLARLEDRAP